MESHLPQPHQDELRELGQCKGFSFLPALPLSLVALGKALYLPSLNFLLRTMGTVLPPPGCSGEKMKECTQSSGQGPAIEGFHDCRLRTGPGARPWLGVRAGGSSSSLTEDLLPCILKWVCFHRKENCPQLTSGALSSGELSPFPRTGPV